MSKEDIIIASALARKVHMDFRGDGAAILFDPGGLVRGLNRVYVGSRIFSSETTPIQKDNEIQRQFEEFLEKSLCIPLPFWNGIHPTHVDEMKKHLKDNKDPYWDAPMAETVRPQNTTNILPTELELLFSTEKYQDQVDFVLSMLPKGIINTIVITKGQDSFWRNVPFANAFASDPHQMSIADRWPLADGFSNLQLTTTESQTTPAEWQTPFPAIAGAPKNNTIAWMNAHQIGHGLLIPPCWEYKDRTYSLVTPRECLDLAITRLDCLNEWFHQYSGLALKGDYEPDSTSYLYEIKIVQRALAIKKYKKLGSDEVLRDDLYWYRGLHLDEMAKQLQVHKRDIIAGIHAMEVYLQPAHHSKPKDPVMNALIQATDFGTHANEEITVDLLAKNKLGILPERHKYWKTYTDKVDYYWKRWEDTTSIHSH
jgi:hypothetical protein